MAVFVLLTTLEGQVPRSWYVGVYGFKVAAVAACLWAFRGAWKGEIRAEARVLPIAVLVGLAVFAEWILLDKWIPYPHLGARTAFNPFTEIAAPVPRGLFLAARLFGLALLVPVMEEVFWRSFLLRQATILTDPKEDDDFRRLPVGTFSWPAFFVVAGVFGLAHGEWLVAVICGFAYALLLRQTKSLFACIVAHAVTNGALGAYVLITGDWKYW